MADKIKKAEQTLLNLWESEAHRLVNHNLKQKVKFELLQNKQFLELIEHSPTIVLIINHLESTYEYCSKNVKNLLGYTAEEMCEGGVPLGLSFVEEKHAIVFQDFVLQAMFENMQLHKRGDELKKIRLSYNFRTKRKDGKIIWLLQHMSFIETDDEGGALMSMVFMTDVSHMKKDDMIDFSVSRLNESGCFQPIFTTSFPKKSEKIEFSTREYEIISLINKKYSSDKIADALFISKNTVSTHRKNILSKLKVKNNSELLETLKTRGLLT